MTKVIGLTGGIGSGKSTIAQLFAQKGIPVYIADKEAKGIMNSKAIIKQVQLTFGDDVIINNTIDRAKLASIVFNNTEKLTLLNAIVHPAVQKHFKKWLKKHNEFPFVIKEVAILFETGGDLTCDKIITVIAQKDSRIKRVMLRDHVTEDAVLARMNNQWTDEQKIAKSDYVIDNNDFEQAKIEVNEILTILSSIV